MYTIPIKNRATIASMAGVGALLTFSLATMAPATTLSFDGLVGTATGTTVIGNHSVVTSETARFTSVAVDNGQVVDAIIEATVLPDTDFGTIGNGGSFGDAGFIPSYRPSRTDTDSDLAFLYYGNGVNENANGVNFRFSFFDGNGALSGTFSNAITVSELEFAVYDVDGESIVNGNRADQSEYFRAYINDGLASYAVGDTPQALTATEMGDSVEFYGPDKNFSEADPSGAVILNFKNTDAFTLAFGSVQRSGPSQNGVFSAFDGDLSLFSKADFIETETSPAPVPLPAGLPLLLTGLGSVMIMARRKKAKRYL